MATGKGFLRKCLLPIGSIIGSARATRWRGVRFLCYHSIGKLTDEVHSEGTWIMSAAAFRRHLELMRRSGYTFVSMAQAVDLLRSGTAASGQFVCLTFDDGKLDNFEVAWPVLRSAGYSAHFFVSTSRIGNDQFMDADALRAIVRDGGSIGSHGQTHSVLTEITDGQLMQELAVSRATLLAITGSVVDTLSYPFARYDSRVVAAAKHAGYQYAFAVGAGTVVDLFSEAARFTVPRNLIRSGNDPRENYVTLRGGYDFMRRPTLLDARGNP